MKNVGIFILVLLLLFVISYCGISNNIEHHQALSRCDCLGKDSLIPLDGERYCYTVYYWCKSGEGTNYSFLSMDMCKLLLLGDSIYSDSILNGKWYDWEEDGAIKYVSEIALEMRDGDISELSFHTSFIEDLSLDSTKCLLKQILRGQYFGRSGVITSYHREKWDSLVEGYQFKLEEISNRESVINDAEFADLRHLLKVQSAVLSYVKHHSDSSARNKIFIFVDRNNGSSWLNDLFFEITIIKDENPSLTKKLLNPPALVYPFY